jgi:hypothetical protein
VPAAPQVPPLVEARAATPEGERAGTGVSKDEALKHELIEVLSSLCLAGLTSVLLDSADRRPARYRRRSSGVSRPALR